MHFEGKSEVQRTLRRITDRLDELSVPYAVFGGMALFQHGYRRFTEGIDLLVTAESLEKIHQALDSLGYVRPFEKSKHLRDTDSGVRVEFLVTGQFPGDGKPKPLAFPDPATSTVVNNGLKVLSIEKLIDLKLASGMSNINRLKDLAGVQELVKHVPLPSGLADQLNPFVREKFIELCGHLLSNQSRADVEEH